MCDACGNEEQEIDAALAAAEAELRARATPPPVMTAAERARLRRYLDSHQMLYVPEVTRLIRRALDALPPPPP